MTSIKNILAIGIFFCLINHLTSQAALEISAPDKGLLIPRIGLTGTNDTTTIDSAVISLLVYNTDSVSDIKPGYYYWDGISWVGFTEQRHYVGELYGGGIVFHVYDHGRHGLIASLDDLDTVGVIWGLHGVNVPDCENMTDGAANTDAIRTAGLCDTYTGGGFTDWYLPANRELYLLASRDILIDQILDNDGDPDTNGFKQELIGPTYGFYWSSTEDDATHSWYYKFDDGNSKNAVNKQDTPLSVRAVRPF